jgi:hypothetical protein
MAGVGLVREIACGPGSPAISVAAVLPPASLTRSNMPIAATKRPTIKPVGYVVTTASAIGGPS